ncbi:MAG: hypothetical protein JO030_03155 [Candidatus Eremiobacteraeota bacterium]|nr:hypothetical protein [Candidatus Eremiobacteraeota bacterium]
MNGRRPPSVSRPLIVGALIGFAIGAPLRTSAMPPFAQAYGVKCNVCHTQVPALNTYGRYVQRTGYSSLDPHVLERAVPVWVGENLNYDVNGSPRWTPGNLAVHAVGFLGDDVTYHFQQWIWQNNAAGDLDTFWMTYNNLLHRDGHLFLGFIQAPAPGPFNQWMDLAPFATPQITVGEHAYELDANRWGAKFNYERGSLDIEAGYMYEGETASSNWSASTDFANTDKTFQYKVAYANPQYPTEAGVYGSRGSFPLAEGGFDQYWSLAPYVERDPTYGFPGILAIYQFAHDSNPGFNTLPGGRLASLGPTPSTAQTLEIYEAVFNQGMLSYRHEWTNALGVLTQSANVDFSYPLARFLRLYVEEYFVPNSKPGWAGTIWWTTPLNNVKNP